MDKISVIIPNYNNATTLPACLDSIFNQTHQNFEIIVVDDGSIDQSNQVLNEYQKRDSRLMFVQKPNGGVSNARNTGLKLATGDYIQFIDADDYIEKNMFERLLDAFNKTDADMVTFRFTHDCWKPFLPQGIYYMDKFADAFKLYYDFFTFELPWNKMTKASAIKHLYNENIKIFEGSLFYLDNADGIKKVAVIEDELYHYINSGATDKASCVNGFLKSKFWENKTGYWYKLLELFDIYNDLFIKIYKNSKPFMQARTFDMAFIELVKLLDSHVPNSILAIEMFNIFNELAFMDATALYGYSIKNSSLDDCQKYIDECASFFCKVKEKQLETELYYKYIALFFKYICGAKEEELDFIRLFNKIDIKCF